MLVALAITGNLLALVVDLSGDLLELNGVTQVTTTIMFLYWTLLAIAAMVSTHGQIKGHEEHYAEYSKSIVKFRAADQLLGANGTKGDESLILALVAAAAREIAIWLRVHRVRPLRILL